ncbi:MAG: 4Fe-4S domain-containing protein [Caldimonas sp.]
MNAPAPHPDRLAFHLTGRRAAGLDEVAGMRPALQANYRDLAALRHDFPLVLARGTGEAAPSLRALVDAALASIAKGADAERTRRQVLRVEQEVRAEVQQGTEGTLGELWSQAVQRLAAGRDASFAESAARARAAMAADGPLVGCAAGLAKRLLHHVWQQALERKAAALRERLVRLIQQLSEILRADFENSVAGRDARRLKASVGSGHDALFDFDAMSRLLAGAAPRQPMPAARRERIRRLLAVLDAQPFVALPDADAARATGNVPYGYSFDSCAAALAAWTERLPRLVELARAIEIAELEIDGRYQPDRHDALFAAYGESGLEPEELSRFPDYLVCLDAVAVDAAEQARAMEILAGELPIKLLYRIDDLLGPRRDRQGARGPGLRGRQLAHMAMGLNQVYVLQSPASHLGRSGRRIADAMRFAGPALICVYTGVHGGAAGAPPYLAAAAAMESRAFPAFAYDPSGGSDWASRFSLDDNPQAELDWPIHRFDYEDARHQRATLDLAFTFVDFVAADPRYAAHLARLPAGADETGLVAVDETMLRDVRRAVPDRVPCIRMIDDSDRLHTVVPDEWLLREARRCREMWHSLQELGGVHNSHAERLLARERAAWEAAHDAAPAAAVPAGGATATAAAGATAVAAAPALQPAAAVEPATAEAPAAEAAPSRDEAYIETVRCSTCNECTQINPRMFAYDANQQAYIADLTAGTYAQLVEAAESCQVSVIHPGKPRNPDEPGMAELLVRAEPFR